MKKIYTAPLTQVVKVNAEQIICTSNYSMNTEVELGGGETGLQIADKDDEDFFEDLW